MFFNLLLPHLLPNGYVFYLTWIAKQAVRFYLISYAGRHHVFPAIFALLYHFQHVVGRNVQVLFVVIRDVLDFIVSYEVLKQGLQCWG